MAHMTSHADVEFDNPVGDDGWGTVIYFALMTAETATPSKSNVLFYDNIDDFTPSVGADVRFPSGRIDFNVPNGEMPDEQTLTMLNSWLATRITGLSLATAESSNSRVFTNDNGTVYLAFFTAWTDADTNTEVTAGTGTGNAGGSGYKRKSVTIGNSSGTAAVLQTATGLAAT